MINLDRSKLVVIGGVGAALIVVFMVLRVLTRTETVQPQFRDALIAQFTIVQLSDLAVEKAGDPELRNRASIISSTVNSDFYELRGYYLDAFGELPGENPEQSSIDELAATNEGFDDLYRTKVLGYLRASSSNLESLRGQGSTEFDEAVSEALRNHQAHVDYLTR